MLNFVFFSARREGGCTTCSINTARYLSGGGYSVTIVEPEAALNPVFSTLNEMERFKDGITIYPGWQGEEITDAEIVIYDMGYSPNVAKLPKGKLFLCSGSEDQDLNVISDYMYDNPGYDYTLLLKACGKERLAQFKKIKSHKVFTIPKSSNKCPQDLAELIDMTLQMNRMIPPSINVETDLWDDMSVESEAPQKMSALEMFIGSAGAIASGTAKLAKGVLTSSKDKPKKEKKQKEDIEAPSEDDKREMSVLADEADPKNDQTDIEDENPEYKKKKTHDEGQAMPVLADEVDENAESSQKSDEDHHGDEPVVPENGNEESDTKSSAIDKIGGTIAGLASAGKKIGGKIFGIFSKPKGEDDAKKKEKPKKQPKPKPVVADADPFDEYDDVDTDSAPSEKPKKKPKEKTAKIEYLGHVSVFVTSMRHGTGNSYVAGSIAAGFASKGNSVCICHAAGTNYPEDDKITEYTASDRFEDAFRSRIVVIDRGPFGDMPKEAMAEMRRADIKLLVCSEEERDIERLASFIHKLGEDLAKEWFYVFNLPKSKKRKAYVEELMQDYHIMFLPLHDYNDIPPDIAKKWLNEIKLHQKKFMK